MFGERASNFTKNSRQDAALPASTIVPIMKSHLMSGLSDGEHRELRCDIFWFGMRERTLLPQARERLRRPRSGQPDSIVQLSRARIIRRGIHAAAASRCIKSGNAALRCDDGTKCPRERRSRGRSRSSESRTRAQRLAASRHLANRSPSRITSMMVQCNIFVASAH